MKAKKIILLLLLCLGISDARANDNNCFSNILGNLFGGKSSKEIQAAEFQKANLITPEMWATEKKLLVSGSNKELSFSYDGELAWDELLKFVKNDPETMTSLNHLLGNNRYKKPELMRLLKVSEKQFDSFVIRKESPLAQQESWLITELPPRYFAFMMENFKDSNKIELISKEISKHMNKKGFFTEGHNDSGFVELAHSSFDVEPSVFSGTMKKYEENFPKSTIHLHIGIPNEVVNNSEAIAIGRAIESKIILTLADHPFTNELAYANFSSLRSEKNVLKNKEYRGVIRLGLNEFKGAHNLEIRQYGKMNEGLDLIQLGSNLSMNPKSLYKFDHFSPAVIDDPYTSNLNGALEYVGKLFKNKGTEEFTRLGDEMITMAKEMESEMIISEKMRVKVRKFIEKNKILGKLDDLSLFMKVE
jgi:hypothetical protein